MNIKLEASQASTVYRFQNIKIRLLKTNSHIKFNKECLKNNLIPNYASIRIGNNSKTATKIKKRAQVMWIKEELRYLYAKKTELNKDLYLAHLKLLNNVHASQLDNIFHDIDKYINDVLQRVYTKHDKKLRTLKSKHKPNEDNITCKHEFYARVSNLTSINFNKNEMDILNKGLNYNIPHNNKDHIVQEIIYAEAAIKSIPNINSQNEARFLINNKLNKYLNKITPKLNYKYTNEVKTLKQIKEKLSNNNAMITKADKGNTIVIMDTIQYSQKVNQFIENNNIAMINTDPSPGFVSTLNNTINRCTHIFNSATRHSLKPINAEAPQFTGLPKIHKPNVPIRPLVNFTTAPSYKVSKKLVQIIKNSISLKNNHSTKNCTEFINKLKNVQIKPNYRIASFDIVDLYTNIPVHDTIAILKSNLGEANIRSTDEINEIITLLEVVLNQNYFIFDGKYYIQKKGLAMGSPLSGLLADIYLNHYENTHIFSSANKWHNKIVSYTRYVDDTFIIFDGTIRQINNLKNYLNNINGNIQFTLEAEIDNKLNFLDLTITRLDSSFQYQIYRKPTTTDATIHADSHHPFPQKMAAYNSFIHRLLTVPLEPRDFHEETNTIKHIAKANGYTYSMIDNLIKKHRKRLHNKIAKPSNNRDNTYVTSIYGRTLPHTLTNIFRKMNITLTFRTDNNVRKILHCKSTKPIKQRTGVYKIQCDDCNSFYIGQTGRAFKKRFQEHLPKKDIRNTKSNFARHLVNNNHNYTDFDTNFKPLHLCKKGRFMDALEEFEIYKAFQQSKRTDNLQDGGVILNDQLNFGSNSLYDTAIKIQSALRR